MTTLTLAKCEEENASVAVTQRAQSIHTLVLLGITELHIDTGNYSSAITTLKEMERKEIGGDERMYLQSVLLKLQNLYPESLPLMLEVVSQRRSILGPTHPKLVVPLGMIAELRMITCNYKEASAVLESAESIGSKFYSNSHPIHLFLLHLKSRLLSHFGEYKKALELCTESLRLRKLLFSSLHPSIADCLYTMGEIQICMGAPRGAQKYFEESFGIRKKLYGFDDENLEDNVVHVSIGESVLSIALCGIETGMYLEAFSMLKLGRRIFCGLCSQLKVSNVLMKSVCDLYMAHYNQLMGNFEDAESHYTSSKEEILLCGGEDHDIMGKFYHLYGTYQQTLGRFDSAHDFYSKSTAIVSSNLGVNHPLLARTMLADGTVHRMCGKFEESAGILKSTFSLISDHFEENSLMFGMAVFERAQLLRDSGDISGASRLYTSSLSTVKRCVGSHSAIVAMMVGDIGECLRLQGDLTQANTVLQQAVVMGGKCYGEVHWSVAMLRLTQAMCMIDSRPVDAMRVITRHCMPLLEKVFNNAHPIIIFVNGCIGKAMCIIEQLDNLSYTVTQTLAEGEKLIYGNGRNMVKYAVQSLTNSSSCSFSSTHPWVLELGGWDDPSSMIVDVSSKIDQCTRSGGDNSGVHADDGKFDHPHRDIDIDSIDDDKNENDVGINYNKDNDSNDNDNDDDNDMDDDDGFDAGIDNDMNGFDNGADTDNDDNISSNINDESKIDNGDKNEIDMHDKRDDGINDDNNNDYDDDYDDDNGIESGTNKDINNETDDGIDHGVNKSKSIGIGIGDHGHENMFDGIDDDRSNNGRDDDNNSNNNNNSNNDNNICNYIRKIE